MLQPREVDNIRRRALARSEAVSLSDDPWQPMRVPDWPDMLASLVDADVIVLDADDAAASLPWEQLELRGEGMRDPQHLALRMLRARPPTDAEERATAPARDGLGRALVITNPGPRSVEALPERADEGRRLADALAQRTALKVERLDQPDPLRLLGALLSAPWRLLHVSARGLVGAAALASTSAPGIPLDDAGSRLGAAELRVLKQTPELVVLNLDNSGDAPIWGGLGPAERAALPAYALLQRGTPMLLATAGKTGRAASSAFVATFHDRLLAGETLLQAIVAARQQTRATFPGDDTWSRYQVWGDPDDRFSAARTRRDPRRVPPAAVLAISLDGGPPSTGFWTADGIAVSTGLTGAGVDEWTASDGEQSWRLTADNPAAADAEMASVVIIARPIAGNDTAAPSAALTLARGLPSQRPFDARLLARSERSFVDLEVRARAGRDARHIDLVLSHAGDS